MPAGVSVDSIHSYTPSDSVIFYHDKDADIPIKLGKHLGQATSELGSKYEWDNTWAVEFVSAGPKCYSFLQNNGDSTLKIKGISTHRRNCALDFQAMKAVVLGAGKVEYLLESTEIRRRKGYEVFNLPTSKIFRRFYRKRRVLDATDNMDRG